MIIIYHVQKASKTLKIFDATLAVLARYMVLKYNYNKILYLAPQKPSNKA